LSFVGTNIAADTVEPLEGASMRILVIQRPTRNCIDGMRLDRFTPGHQYEVGASLAALFIAEQWAEPLSGAPPSLVIPLNEFHAESYATRSSPAREIYPPQCDGPAAVAADRRDRDRSKTRST
jgi:hypothetical protein